MAYQLKGLVLAAGLGTRLRPLTDMYPKPLIPFAGSTPLELALGLLAKAGVREVAINSHHRAGMIAEFAAKNPHQQQLLVAHEPEILGTGGVFNLLRSWLGDADLLVINGDVVATFDLEALVQSHRRQKSVATMALLPSVIPGESAVFHDAGRIVAIGKVAPKGQALSAGNFACAQILTPAFLDLLPQAGSFDVISKGYQPALTQGLKISAVLHHGFWHDLRSPWYYWQALRELLNTPALFEATGLKDYRERKGLPTALTADRVLLGHLRDQANIDPLATLGPEVVVEEGCTVAAGARVSASVLLPGTHVASGEILDQVIAGPAMRLPIQRS